MGDMLRTGVEWLGAQRVAHMASAVTYRSSGGDTSVVATYGATDVELVDASGLTVRSRVWDFLIAASALSAEPEPGDEIHAGGRRYEVTGVGGAACWRWSDPYRTTYRIHTQDIGAVE